MEIALCNWWFCFTKSIGVCMANIQFTRMDYMLNLLHFVVEEGASVHLQRVAVFGEGSENLLHTVDVFSTEFNYVMTSSM